MKVNFEINWVCPHCNRDTTVFVEVESPSDYYPDCTCDKCGKDMQSHTLNDLIDERVTSICVEREYFAD